MMKDDEGRNEGEREKKREGTSVWRE